MAKVSCEKTEKCCEKYGIQCAEGCGPHNCLTGAHNYIGFYADQTMF